MTSQLVRPGRRSLFVLCPRRCLAPDAATKAFLEFMLSDDVQGKLVEEQGFIPVSAMKVVKDASGKVSAK